MLGREAGTRGNLTMTSYVANEMQRLGLEPGGENGTWFQVIPMVRRIADSASTLSIGGMTLHAFTDFVPIRPTSTVRFTATLATATYGSVYGGRAGDTTVTLPSAEVDGKLLIFDAPLGRDSQPTATYSTAAAQMIAKYPRAAAIAIAVLDLQTGNSVRGRGPGLVESSPKFTTPFGLLLTSAAAEHIVGAPLASVIPGAIGRPVEAAVRFEDSAVDFPARNVIAILRGSDPALSREYIAIGAHSDHIAPAALAADHDSVRAYNSVMRPNGGDSRVAGPSTPSAAQAAMIRSSLDSLRNLRPPKRDSIYNGADDDGSGSVALLEIAESLASSRRPRRSILLVWHTAEEGGLLGSAWFTDHTTVPHDSIVTQINMDMVGRGEKRDNPAGGPRRIEVIGSRRLSTDLGNFIDSVNAARRVPYQIDYSFDAPGHIQSRYCRSDHIMYARTGIPIAYISRGYHQDYHQVTDEPQYISYEGLANVAGFVRDIAVALANRDDRVRVDKPAPGPLAPCRQ